MAFEPADRLRNRTFVALLVAQFLAAFNDQAIHAAAMFFAINSQALTEPQAISLMPILFYAPWAIFCTLAGFVADRYSKRASLVFWKWAEVGICAVALLGFWLGTHGVRAGPWVVLSTVFLMGMHSAFFVPAKYGCMPEILRVQILSRGNGVLESLSFFAVILGTVSGGMLSFWFLGQEYWIGIILIALALVGALASLLIQPIPAANPGRPFPRAVYGPLWDHLRELLSAKALAFAVIGIAFFTFVVAFMRATMYMLGESQNPRWNEMKTSVTVGIVAVGIGLGSPLAGWLSGKKVELGLVPLGGLGMILGACAAALSLVFHSIAGLVASIALIGFCTGFYLVPLFTLLQHRAPKTEKGTVIATSNFVNVTGAIVASLLFFLIVSAAQKTGFVSQVEPTDRYAVGTLTQLEEVHGRPYYAEVRQADGTTVALGRPPTEKQRHRLFASAPRDYSIDLTYSVDRPVGDQPGGEVVVSYYELRRVRHFTVRAAGEPLKPAYDNEHLPELLFLGAGLLTFATLTVLRRELPDLYLRTRYFLGRLGHDRLQVIGQQHLPTAGPVLLVTDASAPTQRRSLVLATDRCTWFLPGPAETDTAAEVLRRDHLVALALNGAPDTETEHCLRLLAERVPGLTVVPVTSSGTHVAFGPAVKPDMSAAELRAAVARAVEQAGDGEHY